MGYDRIVATVFFLAPLSLACLNGPVPAYPAESSDRRDALKEPIKGERPTILFYGEGETDRLQPGVRLFVDRRYELSAHLPDWLVGKRFLRTSIERSHLGVTASGVLTLLTPPPEHPHTTRQDKVLQECGFRRINKPASFQLFGPNAYEQVCIYQKHVAKGERLRLGKFAIAVGFEEATAWEPSSWTENRGEQLYNGIVLPAEWPPQHLDPLSDEPMPVPCLDHPPEVIPIDVGRQLFVDDFLVEETDLTRVFHRAEKYAGNPVFKAETQDEVNRNSAVYLGQGGVFFDPTEHVFKMFYVAGWRGGLAMATSKDMVHWNRPDLGIADGNLLLPPGPKWTGPELRSAGTDNCVWYDLNAKNPCQRIKFLTCWMHVPVEQRPDGFNHTLHTSADGRAWSPAVRTGLADDYCSFFFNPFRNVWVFSIKQGGSRGRSRFYAENADFLQGADWSKSVYWTNADRLDKPEPKGRYPGAGDSPQLYSLNAVAYESLLIGMHYIHRGPNNKICAKGRFPKLLDLELGFSRDGFHWHRPDRRGFIVGEREEGAWDRAYLHSTAGVFTVLRDKLVFPYVGTSGIAPDGRRSMYTGLSIGLAMLRRDGFASMDAGEKTGTLTTRPVTFSGTRLFVNVKSSRGAFRVEVLDESGRPIEPFTLDNCRSVATDSTLTQVTWKGTADLSRLRGKPVRFRFELTNGSLYAFWVSRDETGRSDGYVAAGGPGCPGTVDTAGKAVLERVNQDDEE